MTLLHTRILFATGGFQDCQSFNYYYPHPLKLVNRNLQRNTTPTILYVFLNKLSSSVFVISTLRHTCNLVTGSLQNKDVVIECDKCNVHAWKSYWTYACTSFCPPKPTLTKTDHRKHLLDKEVMRHWTGLQIKMQILCTAPPSLPHTCR